ncbi:MurR/RpiR family transcriptional regulator [Lapidilactobacillus bayanensis]|uniref:MurR/RpiR family transcriptional regulator n=1 Tax=Lapidilactobacillus bayanensis TaxID=2485998 RepID=UPI0013DDB095|nr:MurR/RpiR family transcriptional regulator [Lapidilactobacillus bayanensis]
MFHNIDLKSLSELELDVYNYIISHPKKIQQLTIRQLAKEAHVSTTTISRFCQKMNLSGYSELKYVIRDELQTEQRTYSSYDISTPLTDFFTKVSRDEFDEQLSRWVAMALAAKIIVFVGIGSSGNLASYGARFLNNAGGFSFALTDPVRPAFIREYNLDETLVVALSVSGNTENVLAKVADFKQRHAKIIAITNHENSPITKLADLTISYYMPERSTKNHTNMTTQVPVVYLLETFVNQFVEASGQSPEL